MGRSTHRVRAVCADRPRTLELRRAFETCETVRYRPPPGTEPRSWVLERHRVAECSRCRQAKTLDVRPHRLNRNSCGASDVNELKVARPHELIGRGPTNTEQPTCVDDLEKERPRAGRRWPRVVNIEQLRLRPVRCAHAIRRPICGDLATSSDEFPCDPAHARTHVSTETSLTRPTVNSRLTSAYFTSPADTPWQVPLR